MDDRTNKRRNRLRKQLQRQDEGSFYRERPQPSRTRVKKEGGKKVLFHLGTEYEAPQEGVPVSAVGHHDSPIEDYMDLLCEELEISTALLTLLKEQKMVEDNIKEDIDKQGSRSKKIKYLLNQVNRHGYRGYEVLKQHNKEANEDLYKELIQLDTSAKSNLDSQPWYHGLGTRQGVDKGLIAHNVDGMYCIRKSTESSFVYVLAVYYHGKPYNLPVRETDDHRLALGAEEPGEHTFTSLVEMVNFFKMNFLVLADCVALLGPENPLSESVDRKPSSSVMVVNPGDTILVHVLDLKNRDQEWKWNANVWSKI